MEVRDKVQIEYKKVMNNINFNINASKRLFLYNNMTLFDVRNRIFNEVENKEEGCSYHYAFYLSKLLRVQGIDSEIILNIDARYKDENKHTSACVLYEDNNEYFVACLDNNELVNSGRHKNKYAYRIPLKHFLDNYVKNYIVNLGSIYKGRNEYTFSDYMSSGEIISKKKLLKLKQPN